MMELLEKYMLIANDPQLALGSGLLAVGGIVFLLLLKKFSEAKKDIPLDPVTGMPLAPELPPLSTPAPSSGAAPGASPALSSNATVRMAPPPSMDVTKTLVLPANENAPRPGVDLTMYETLVRRVSSVENEVKKDPLFLDPLFKRLATIEKRLEDIPTLAQRVEALSQMVKNAAAASAPVPGAPSSGISPEEFNAVRERVNGMHKILEHLAESPMNPPQ